MTVTRTLAPSEVLRGWALVQMSPKPPRSPGQCVRFTCQPSQGAALLGGTQLVGLWGGLGVPGPTACLLQTCMHQTTLAPVRPCHTFVVCSDADYWETPRGPRSFQRHVPLRLRCFRAVGVEARRVWKRVWKLHRAGRVGNSRRGGSVHGGQAHVAAADRRACMLLQAGPAPALGTSTLQGGQRSRNAATPRTLPPPSSAVPLHGGRLPALPF